MNTKVSEASCLLMHHLRARLHADVHCFTFEFTRSSTRLRRTKSCIVASSSETQEKMTNLQVELTLTSKDIPADLPEQAFVHQTVKLSETFVYASFSDSGSERLHTTLAPSEQLPEP